MKAFERFFIVLKKAQKPDTNSLHDFDLFYDEKKHPWRTFLDSKEILLLTARSKIMRLPIKRILLLLGKRAQSQVMVVDNQH